MDYTYIGGVILNDFEFGQYLRQLRISKGLSQFQLGKLVGVSDKAVSKWENGISKPKTGIILKLSDILSVSTEDLLQEMFAEKK